MCEVGVESRGEGGSLFVDGTAGTWSITKLGGLLDLHSASKKWNSITQTIKQVLAAKQKLMLSRMHPFNCKTSVTELNCKYNRCSETACCITLSVNSWRKVDIEKFGNCS